MGLGRGKLQEAISVKRLFAGTTLGAPTIFYNGGAFTTTANLIDCAGVDEAVFALSFGAALGSPCTLSNTIVESDTNDPTAASVIAGFGFATISPANTATLQLATLRTAGRKRFIGLRTEWQGALATIPFAAVAILGKPDSQPNNDTLVIDL
jgi:hypothetical protein